MLHTRKTETASAKVIFSESYILFFVLDFLLAFAANIFFDGVATFLV